MATSLEIIRARYPAYDGVPDSVVGTLTELAVQEIGVVMDVVWSDLYGQAVAALTAHMLEVRARSAAAAGGGGAGSGGTASGGITSLKTGDVSISYADGGSTIAGKSGAGLGDAVLATTVGGQDYLRLRSRIPNIAAVVP